MQSSGKRFMQLILMGQSPVVLFFLGIIFATAVSAKPSIQIGVLGTYSTGIYNSGGSEISAYDPGTHRLFIVNAKLVTIDIVDITNPTVPALWGTIDVTAFGAAVNSVDVCNGLVAVAVENFVKTDPGLIVFFDVNGYFLKSVEVGALPDMVTFTPNNRYVLAACEAEPNEDYTVDPEGAVAIINVSGGVSHLTQADVRLAGFSAFNNATLDPSIRIFGPNATVAQDIEPEYITVSNDSKTAWATLQENNALAVIDIKNAVVTKLIGLGFKDHSLPGMGLDASDKDGKINIQNWPVKGMYLPDGIDSYRYLGKTYLILPNEGDSRVYPTGGANEGGVFNEEKRIGSVALDPVAFPNAAMLKLNANLGRLKITNTRGDIDNDGDFDELYSFGARSFSIRNDKGQLVFDSGDQLEQITAAAYPAFFNSGHTVNLFDDRSDDKGPEAENVALGELSSRTYAFIGLERIGGIMVYDVTDPYHPVFEQYLNNRDFTQTPGPFSGGDLGPEGIIFIKQGNSPIGKPLIVVTNEISGSTTVYEVNQTMHQSEGGNALSEQGKPIVKLDSVVPKQLALYQNYPNPFNPTTTISFGLPESGNVSIKVFDLLGQQVATITDAYYEAGNYALAFHAGNLASGKYFYRLDVNGTVRLMRQFTLLK
jgi:2',3'-cyclic-nucleotide 2'-phosphodiesterase/3'-nucleotidase/5'-nucleotidase